MRSFILSYILLFSFVFAAAVSAEQPPSSPGEIPATVKTKHNGEVGLQAAGDSEADGSKKLPLDVPQETQPVSMDDIFSEQERAEGMDPFVSEKKKKADEYFTRGVLLYEGEDFASAAEAFQVAYETLPHPAVLGNIAMCYDNAGKIPEAVTFYRRYFKDPVKSSKNDLMVERLKALSVLVSDLQLACAHNCEIRVDGIARGNGDSQVIVMPGRHRVEGVLGGRVVVSEIVSVEAKEIKDFTIKIPEPESETAQTPLTVPITIPPATKPPSQLRLSPGFWFSSGLTVVSLSLVTAFGTMTLNKKADYRASEWTDEDSMDRGKRYKTVTNAMVGLAGASAAAALLFAISDNNDHQKKDSRVKVEPSVSMGAGVAISF